MGTSIILRYVNIALEAGRGKNFIAKLNLRFSKKSKKSNLQNRAFHRDIGKSAKPKSILRKSQEERSSYSFVRIGKLSFLVDYL